MSIVFVFIIVVTFLVIILAIIFNIFTPPVKGIPVLMYHKISDEKKDGLTVGIKDFEKQLSWLKSRGYKSLQLKEIKYLSENNKMLPENSVVITFDDGYSNFLTTAYPLLNKYGFTSVVFLPVGHAGKVNSWDSGTESLMTFTDLRKLAAAGDTEIGIHSFDHRSYGNMSIEEMENDIFKCREKLSLEKVPYSETLAYPYGAYPRKDKIKREKMFGMFRDRNLEFAMRIGNRVNRWPLLSPYEIQRIDIKGNESLFAFGRKVRKGRLKMFT